ncbi:MAG TPA: hypothetical protein ENI62_11740, partial [Gammaproteobacteria bacterium]|nr:hypothetical protein [Gammaproteobacteria bacterium]
MADQHVSEQPEISKAYHLNGLQLKKDLRQGMRLTLRRLTPSSLDLVAAASWRGKKFRLWLVFWHATGGNAYKVLTFYHNKAVSVSPKTPFVRANLSYDFLLPDQPFDVVRVIFFPASGAMKPEVVIDKLQVVETVWEDNLLTPYLVALGLLLLLLIPALGLVEVLGRKYHRWQSRVLLIFPGAMLFWLLAFVLFIGLRGALPDQVSVLYPALVLLSVLTLAAPAWRSLHSAPELARAVLFFMISGLLLTHVMIKDTPLPEQNFSYNSVSGPKTFWAFYALDNYFPYVNARALARNESFEKYYGPSGYPALFYQPEDREMASGAIYAAIRSALEPLSHTVADSYVTFASVALFFNLMVMFPLWLLVKRYLPDRNPLPVLLATAATAFFMGNLFMSWFKMAGAALFLCGLVWWLIHTDKHRWWIAGLLFGLATNMHASLAMGLPVLFIWFIARDFRATSPDSSALERSRKLLGPLQFGLVFTLVNLPWAVVKELFFKRSTVLLQQMFLNGENDPRGLWATVKLFFAHYPLPEQFHYRLQQMFDSLQLVNWAGIFTHLGSNFFQGLRLWNLFEFDRVSMLFAPLLFFVLLQGLWSRFGPSLAEKMTDHHQEQRQLLWVCAISTLLLLFLAYGAAP